MFSCESCERCKQTCRRLRVKSQKSRTHDLACSLSLSLTRTRTQIQKERQKCLLFGASVIRFFLIPGETLDLAPSYKISKRNYIDNINELFIVK